MARNAIPNLTTGVPLEPLSRSRRPLQHHRLLLDPCPAAAAVVLISDPQQRGKGFLIMPRTVPAMHSARKRSCDPGAGQRSQKRTNGAPSDGTEISAPHPRVDSAARGDTLTWVEHDGVLKSLLLVDFRESPKASCSCSMANI
jgi:hypothetical protein